MEKLKPEKPRKQRAIGFLAERILDRLPKFPNDDEQWQMTVDQIAETLDASKVKLVF